MIPELFRNFGADGKMSSALLFYNITKKTLDNKGEFNKMELKKEYGLFIGGEWKKASSGETFEP